MTDHTQCVKFLLFLLIKQFASFLTVDVFFDPRVKDSTAL